MNSNKIFSISRFYLLLYNDILLNHKKYLYIIAAAFVLEFVVLYMQMPKIEFLDNNYWFFGGARYQIVFIMCLFGLGGFVGTAFSELNNKVKTSNYLLIPTSTFEKFLSQFVIRVLVGTTIFLFVFWVDAHVARSVALSQMEGPNHEPASANVSKSIAEFHYSMLLVKDVRNGVVTYWKQAEGIAIILGVFSIGMYLFSVKLFFKKMGLVKAIISLVTLIYLMVAFMGLLSPVFFPETKEFDIKTVEYTLQNGFSNINIWLFSLGYFTSLFLIPLGYFKLKEKQL